MYLGEFSLSVVKKIIISYCNNMLTKTDLQAIKALIQDEINPLKNDVNNINKDVKHIRKDIKTIIDVFDTRDVRLQKRTRKIEEHLG